MRELPAVPVLVVAITAPDHGSQTLGALRKEGTSIDLGPITSADVRELAALSGHESDTSFIWDLTRATFCSSPKLWHRSTGECSPMTFPSSLRTVVLGRVQGAGRETEDILRAAAFIGPAFDIATLEELLGYSAGVLDLLLNAVTEGLLDATGPRFVFANRVIRDVLYETAMGPVRNRYHRLLAEMVTDGWAKATHLEAADEHGDAAQAWFSAAETARRSFANRDVAEMFWRAAKAAAKAGDDELRARALLGSGAAQEEIGNYELATWAHREAEEVARKSATASLFPGPLSGSVGPRTTPAMSSGQGNGPWEAVALPGAHPSAWVLAGRIHHWGGEFDRATEAYETALEQPDTEGGFIRASALSCLGALLEHGDRYDDALRILDEAVQLSQDIGAFRPLLRALFFQGIARANAGELSGALIAFETKATLLERYEVTFYRARTKTCLAWVWRELGEHGRSRDLSQSALEDSRQVEAGELQIEQELHALSSLAECDLLDEQEDRAAENIAAARQLLTGWLPFHGRAELRVLDVETRLGLAEAGLLNDKAEAAKSTKYLALAAAYLGDPERATELAEKTGSSLLLAEVSSGPAGEAATSLVAAQLPRALRQGFVSNGRLAKRKS